MYDVHEHEMCTILLPMSCIGCVPLPCRRRGL